MRFPLKPIEEYLLDGLLQEMRKLLSESEVGGTIGIFKAGSGRYNLLVPDWSLVRLEELNNGNMGAVVITGIKDESRLLATINLLNGMHQHSGEIFKLTTRLLNEIRKHYPVTIESTMNKHVNISPSLN